MLPVARKPCALITIVKSAGAELCLDGSVTVTVIGNDPVVVGVPDRVPVLLENVSPVGSAPDSLQVAGCATIAVNVKL